MPTRDSLRRVVSDLARKIRRRDRALGRIQSQAQQLQSSASGFGLVELSSKVTVTSSASTQSWTTFSAAPYVPSSAKGVVLEAEGNEANADVGTAVRRGHVRTDSTSIERVVLHIRENGAGSDGAISDCSQVFCPLTPNLTFDYDLDGAISSYALRITDYWT